MANAFSTRCISSDNPERIDNLVIVCEIPPAPDPCFEYPFDIPLPPPHIYGFGCVCPTATFIGKGVAKVSGRFGPKDSDCCDLDFHIEIDVPPADINCPALKDDDKDGGQKNLKMNQSASAWLDIRKDSSSDCVFTFDLDIGVPCPVVTPAVSRTPRSPSEPKLIMTSVDNGYASVIVKSSNSSENCSFVLDLDIGVPCPEISNESTGVHLRMDEPPKAEISVISENSSTGCSFTLDLEIGVPCPKITTVSSVAPRSPGAPNLIMTGIDHGYANVVVSSNNSSTGCEFTLDLDIGVPCPKISMSSTAPNVLKLKMNQFPKANILVTESHSSTGCQIMLDLDIGVPCPDISTSSAKVVLNQYPGATLSVSKDHTASDCNYDMDLNITIPCEKVIVSSQSLKMNQPANVTLTTVTDHASDDCKVYLNLDVGVPCPVFTGYQDLKMNQPKSVNLTFAPDHTNAACVYTYDLDINVA